jgi:hypothetical protein
MKLSRRVWLIAGIVVIAVVLGVLFSIYHGQAGERAHLEERLSRAQTLLPGLVANREDLEDELSQAQSSLDRSRAEYPGSVDSIQYDDDLFEIADACNVQITRLTSSRPTNKAVGSVTYSVSGYAINVGGTIEDLLEFIYAIRTGDGFQLPWSAEVNSIIMNFSGPTASINLNIYAYEG